MAQTIYGSQVGSELLRAGEMLTVTVDAGSGAVVERIRDGELVEKTAPSVSTTYGPYLTDMVFRLSVFAGATVRTSTSVQSAERSNDSEAAAGQALVSEAGIAGHVSKLQDSLDTGFGVFSFSRASANASVVDCYGAMQFCVSGEARIYGARRVENRVVDTEGATTGWTFASAPQPANIKSPNHGRKSAWTVPRASGTTQLVVLNSQSYRPGKWCWSAWVLGDGATQYTMRIERSGDSAGTSQVVTPAAGVLTRIVVTHDIVDTSNHRAILTVAASGAASVTYLDPQMEWVHGQPSPAPSDYIPRGVPTSLLPASAYGIGGADGVRYYGYLNPWTLASGAATRGTALTSIDPTTIKGVAVAGAAATNQIYSSGNPSAAQWGKQATVNATPADSTLLGKGSLWKIEQTSATQEHRIGQTWPGAIPATLAINAPLSASCYAKPGDAACPFVWLFIGNMNGTPYYAYFNVQTGKVATVTAGAEAWMFREGDCWSLNMVVPSGTSAGNSPFIRIGVTQTDNLPNPAGTAGNGNWIGGAQFEAGLPTSYMGDTATNATLTRAAELLTAVSTDMPAVDWTVSVDLTTRFPTGTALKPTWLYGLYSANPANPIADRGGFGWRPAEFGNFYNGGQDQTFWDFYPGISADNLNWDGIHLKTGSSTGVVNAQPMETHRYQWSLATSAQQPSGSNQTGAVGAILGTSAGNDQPRPAINSWPTNPRTWTIGRQSASIAQRGELYCANLSWWPYARTAAQMQQAAV